MAAAESQNALWGEKSLSERFGGLTGRALQDQIFMIYQAIGFGCPDWSCKFF